MKNKNLIPFRETAIIALGEAIVSGLIIAVFAIIGKFDYTVALGALLGSLVIVLNFLFLSLATNRAIDRIMELRPEGEMDDEQAAKFAGENAMKLQNIVKLSFIIRTFSMLAAFIVALITGVFNVIATVIPLFMLRPIIYVTEIFRRKLSRSTTVEGADFRDITDTAEGSARDTEALTESTESECGEASPEGDGNNGECERTEASCDATAKDD